MCGGPHMNFQRPDSEVAYTGHYSDSATWLQQTADGNYLGEKKSRKFQKGELEFATHRQLFTQPLVILGIVSNLEMTKYTGGCA